MGLIALIYDGVDAPPTASMCQSGGVEHHLREASVSEVSIIGLDIAKHVFFKKRSEAKAKRMLLKRPKRLAKRFGWSISPSILSASLKSARSSRHSSRCQAVWFRPSSSDSDQLGPSVTSAIAPLARVQRTSCRPPMYCNGARLCRAHRVGFNLFRPNQEATL
jgi:hypothetical protein